MTCLVGKNEAGKSALLEALYLLNPAYDESFDVNDQYPRWLVVRDRRTEDLEDVSPISATFELSRDDVEAVADVLGEGVVVERLVRISRAYSGRCIWVTDFIDARAAVTNAVNRMPPTVSPLVGSAVTQEALVAGVDGIEPVEDGEGPTAADVAAAREVLSSTGLDSSEPWRVAARILGDRMPRFFRFTEYSTLPGRIDFVELADAEDATGPGRTGMRTAQALLKLAGTEVSQLREDDYELRRGELEAVQIDLTRQVFEYWKQNPELEVKIDVDKMTQKIAQGHEAVARYLDIRVHDRRTGYSNNFRQRSSGFQWFFSFLAAFSEFEGHEDDVVVLLDEPALTLHGKAQADFLRFINERLAPNAPVLYTTHSPFLVEPGQLERVRLVEDKGPDEWATASADVLDSDPDSLFPLQAALGYDIAQNLFVGPHNLVVEGTSDFLFLTILSRMLVGLGRPSLDERWRLLPAGGATNIPTFVALIGPHLDITVLADSDTRGMQRITNMIAKGLLDAQRLVRPDNVLVEGRGKADIEDLFTEGDYLKAYNGAFATSVRVKDLPPGDRITKRLERHVGSDFDHGAPAEWLLRNPDVTFTETTFDNWEALIVRLNETLGSDG